MKAAVTALLTGVVVSLLPVTTWAIDETESLRQRSQNKASFTNLSLDLSGKSGNSDTEQFSAGLYHSKRYQNHFAFVMASREFAKSNGQESANSSFAHVRYNYYLSDDHSVEVFYQTNVDDFRSLLSRDLAGMAYRQELTNSSAFGIGLFNETERYLVTNEKIKFDQVRLSTYWVYLADLSKHASISNTLYYQPNVEAFSDWRAYNRFKIESKITENVRMSFGVLIEHDSQPVLDVESTDVQYQAGFEYEF